MLGDEAKRRHGQENGDGYGGRPWSLTPFVSFSLLTRDHREAMLAFDEFARMAAGIADAAGTALSEKLARLDALEKALVPGGRSTPEAECLQAVERKHGAGIAQARDLLRALRQDVVKARYSTWAELIDQCRLSANPFGHFLLRLHGEGYAMQPPMDALCTALRILGRIRDCRLDLERHGRIYLPLQWLMGSGSESAFFDPSQAAKRRTVLNAMLDRTEALIDQAQSLPRQVQDRRLRAQCTAMISLAQRLSARIRRHDPLVHPVQVGRTDVVGTFVEGLRAAFIKPANEGPRITALAAQRAAIPFRLARHGLTDEQCRAADAVCAFYGTVSAIVDAGAPSFEKRHFLREWQREIDKLHRAPETPIGRELARASSLFKLPLEECHALLDGMETQSADRVRLASEYEFRLHRRRIAGSLGILLTRILGVPSAQDCAVDLGLSMQTVNILRDLERDGARERIYIPLSRLSQLGLRDAPAAVLMADPRFGRVCQGLAEEAQAGFAAAEEALRRLDRTALKPLARMIGTHRRLLNRLEARGWSTSDEMLQPAASDRLRLIGREMRPARG